MFIMFVIYDEGNGKKVVDNVGFFRVYLLEVVFDRWGYFLFI